jgi:hypothetical protein
MRTLCRHRSGLLALLAASLMAASSTEAAAPLVDATLEPSQISLGESAQLTITTSGSGINPPKLPEVPGLELRVVGQSQRMQIINGATLASSSIIVRVTPQSAGIFTIPALTPNSQPLLLRVNPAGTPASPGKLPGLGSPGMASSANGIRMAADGAAFVRLILPKRDIYVGESVPVDIEVGLRDGFARPNALPTLTGSDFTLNNLSHQPEQTQRLIDGKPYVVLTWHSVVSAVKPGKFTLTVESPLTVRIRVGSQGDSRIEDMLGDPFLQNFFGATVTKEITASSLPAELTVLELPVDGRPPGFSGAVGSFKITGDLASTAAAAGDPLTLRMHVTGSGNFDRVDSPMLEHLDQWKTYPPKSSFKAVDALGLKGEKIFEQPLIASKPGRHTLPGLAFSYFDPGSHRYETAHTAPLDVTIAESPADVSVNATHPSAGSASAAGTAATPATPGLRPDHVATESASDTLTPPYLQARFLALPALLALTLAGVWWDRRRRADGSAGHRLPARKSIDRVLEEMERAARAGDAAAFFQVARIALETGAITSDADDESRRLLALADEAKYAALRPTREEYERWLRFMRDARGSGPLTGAS